MADTCNLGSSLATEAGGLRAGSTAEGAPWVTEGDPEFKKEKKSSIFFMFSNIVTSLNFFL